LQGTSRNNLVEQGGTSRIINAREKCNLLEQGGTSRNNLVEQGGTY
jgi:hypothetical protein